MMTQDIPLEVHHTPNQPHHSHNHSNSAHSITVSMPGGPNPQYDLLQTCKKCNQAIFEGHAYELGDDRWHIHCFVCSKCDSSLGCNSNFLVLGNGNLICSNCSYNCKQCGKKIDDLAILTGDQAYCSNCFKCRSCKMKIEDLRYARTSKGLFCMECHEKLMAKKKKYDAKKKQLALIKQQQEERERNRELERERERERERELELERERELELERQQERDRQYDIDHQFQLGNELEVSRTGNSSRNSFLLNYMSASNSTTNFNDSSNGNGLFLHNNPSTSSVGSKNKILPTPPQSQSQSQLQPTTRTLAPATTSMSNPPVVAPYSSLTTRESYQSTKTDSSIPSIVSGDSSKVGQSSITAQLATADNDFSIEEVNNYSDGDDESAANRNTSLRPQRSPRIELPARRTLSPRPSSQSQNWLQQSIGQTSQVSSPNSASQYSTPPVGIENKSKKENEGTFVDAMQIPHTPAIVKDDDKLQPAADITPKTATSSEPSEPVTRSPASPGSNFQGKNVLILSPNQYNDHEFHNTQNFKNSPVKSFRSNESPVLDDKHNQITTNPNDIKANTISTYLEEPKTRSACPSPFAKANRQARVVETNDFISTENLDDLSTSQRDDSSVTTPRKNNSGVLPVGMSSPPPRLPLPSTPSKKSFRPEDTTPRGLGLEGVEYEESVEAKRHSSVEKRQRREDVTSTPQSQQQQQFTPNMGQFTPTSRERVIGNTTPSVTNLEEEADKVSESTLSRKNTLMRTPILGGLKHKRSISGGSSGLSNKFSFFRSSKDEVNGEKGHSRHVSEGSINGGSAFTTPPLPMSSPGLQNLNGLVSYNRDHQRSTSDTPLLTSLEPHSSTGDFGDILDLKSLHAELIQITNQKRGLSNDCKRLAAEKTKLSEQVKSLNSRVSSESSKLESLVMEISNLEKQKKKLLDINQALSEENHQLELHRSTGSKGYADSSTVYSDSSTLNQGHASKNGAQSTLASNSSSSLVAGAPYSEASDEPNGETQKATRLKFWRRPKIGFNTANLVSTNSNSQGQSTYQSHQQYQQQYQQAQQQQQQQLQHQHPQSQPKQAYQQSQIEPIPQLQAQTQSQPQQQPQLHSSNSNNGGSKISQSYSSNAIQVPQSSPKSNGNVINAQHSNGSNGSTSNNNNLQVGERKGKFIKSKSSNILDSFLNGTPLGSGSEPAEPTVPLLTSTIQSRADFESSRVPLIVTRCLKEVEKRGLDMEGIYRISGGNSAIVAIENAFSTLPAKHDEKQLAKLEESISGDINAVTSALKRYLRKLPDPLIPFALYEEFIKVSQANPPSKLDKRISDMKTKVINYLPSANKHTMYLLCKHLALVSSLSNVNRMGFKNLSVVFAPTIARDETGDREMTDMGYRNDATELLLTHSEAIFADYSG